MVDNFSHDQDILCSRKQAQTNPERLVTDTIQVCLCLSGPSKKGLSFGSARGMIDVLLEDYRSPTTTWFKTQASCTIHYSNQQSSKYWTQKGTKPRPSETYRLGRSREYYDELQERKRLRREHVTAYEDFRYMLGTSAPVERLFSTAKYMLKDRRKTHGPYPVRGTVFEDQTRVLEQQAVDKAIKRSHATGTDCSLQYLEGT
ncbi:hypothetical protein GQ600_381 [Phytophthora cactorum]|nr:hypothetical protein GQ600_381 [Phytophthora cactorum]